MRIVLTILYMLTLLQAETFVRDYTYNASENDSKVTARKAAMRELERLVIEEAGIEVMSQFSKDERLDDDRFKQNISSQLVTYSKALTKTKILDESWDGEQFYLKVEIVVDPSRLSEAIIHNRAQSAEEDLCQQRQIHFQSMLKDLSSEEKIDQLVKQAVIYPYTNACADFHKKIMYTFVRYKIDNDLYNTFLYDILRSDDLPSSGEYAPVTVTFLMRQQLMDKKVRESIFDMLKRQDYSNIYTILSEMVSTLTQKEVQDLISMAEDGQLGLPRSMQESEITYILLMEIDDPQLYNHTFCRYGHLLPYRQQRSLFKRAVSEYLKQPSDKSYQAFMDYFETLTDEKALAENLFLFASFLEHATQADDYYVQHAKQAARYQSDRAHDLARLLEDQQKRMRQVFGVYGSNYSKKEQLAFLQRHHME